MRRRPRLAAFGFGCVCAAIILAVAGVLGEMALREKERTRNKVTRVVGGAPTGNEIEKPAAPETNATQPKPESEPQSKPAIPAVPSEEELERVGEISPSNRRIYLDDPDFGYRHAPLRRATEVRVHEEREVYRATYTTDALGRRATPRPANAERAILFVGCSFTFGLGVNDDETLPWHVAKQIPESN